MKSRAARWSASLARWLVAVVGIVWVVNNLHLRDRVLVLDDQNVPHERVLARPVGEDAPAFAIQSESSAGITTALATEVPRDRVINGPDRKTVALADGRTVPLLGMRLTGDLNRHPAVDALLVGPTDHARFVPPGDVAGGFALDGSRVLAAVVLSSTVQRGILTMVKTADASKLAGAFAVAPIAILFTTYRWRKLLGGLGVFLTGGRTLVLNMVGNFYNTFMPGSTGGDVLKAYYAAKQAPTRRTAAVMSVVGDRVLGLIALILLGGGAATFQFFRSADPNEPAARACEHVAIACALMLAAAAFGLLMLYTPVVRRLVIKFDATGRSKAVHLARQAMRVLHDYRSRPGLIVWAVVVTFPVHVTAVVSAMLAGQAFGLPLSPGYYFIVVPVVVLAGAIPLSPQGVGVMEAFAYYFTRPQGATLNQALALTLSIRLVAVFWNLVGGLFVLRGGYHAPPADAADSIEHDGVSAISHPTPV